MLSAPALARAADSSGDDGVPRLGLDPGEPQSPSPPPAVPFGVQPAQSREYVLDFHGYLLLPATVGIHQRLMPAVGQSGTVLHSPPLIPSDLRDFEYTGVVPDPWLQRNFIYGNSTVSATVVLAGTSAMDAAGYYNPVDQMGVNDAYVTVNLSKKFGFPFHVNVGAYTGRYGAMGAYDAGRYGTPLIAQTNTIGEQITAAYNVGQVVFLLDQGLGGQLGRPPVGLAPAGWNDFADPNVGATFVNQAHVGIGYRPLGRIGLHYVTAWTQDDQVNNGQVPNGRITVLGADLNLTMGRGGHLYLGAAKTYLTNAATVSGAIEILNARGGPELVAHYLDGPSPTSSPTNPAGNGTGSLSTFGGQYDLSFARLIFGKDYIGASPNLLLSLFGVGTYVKSDDNPIYNDVLKLKGGAEVTYAFLSWLGVSERFDHVRLHGSDSTQAFTSITSRLLFHTGWRSRGEIALQYTYFMYGSGIYPETGYPAMLDPSTNPDKQVVSLIGTFWW
ncbi:MAG TPA: hypothetical protein VHG72_03035 [Polyangia bacterium]|nr:hypothetical protein [Polyangia bacterium]